MKKKDYLKNPVRHIDITSFNSGEIVSAMKGMSFTARDLANAADIYDRMLADRSCAVILTIAGSTGAAGCMKIYADLVKHNMVDAIVATGAAIVDMDFDDGELRHLYIDRIYDTFIDERDLQNCDKTVKIMSDGLKPRSYSSREFISEMGRYLTANAKKKGSLVQTAYENNVPIFCPAFSDSSAGFGLVLHQHENSKKHVSIDIVRDFRELTDIKISTKTTGLFMIGGGVPKNFAQDTAICAELLGKRGPMLKYAVQITIADARDGACSSSTLKEASSWGKVDTSFEQMVFAEATSVLPLIASYAFHKDSWKKRKKWEFAKLFK